MCTLIFASHAFADIINVKSTKELYQAINNSNLNGGNTTLELDDGTFTLNSTLKIAADNITITSKSKNRNKTIIKGAGSFPNSTTGNLIRVSGSFFSLSHITLENSGNHLIQIAGENNAEAPKITNCILRDAREQLLKVSYNANNSNSSDHGIVSNCIFEYTKGIGPQYYIGGIDAHAVKHWTIKNNIFINIASPSKYIAEHAIHLWSNSEDNIIENNTIINCDRGIGLGMGEKPSKGNKGGIIRNNFIHHTANNHPFADTGITLENSSNTQVYNNTIFLENNYPNAIEYRFAGSTGIQILNNITNKAIKSRDGGTATVTNNYATIEKNSFDLSTLGDLRLSEKSQSHSIPKGIFIKALKTDIDGKPRPNPPTLGAAEPNR